MSKQSRARAAAEATTSAAASAASRALPPDRPNPFFARWGAFLAGVVVVLAAWAAYHNSFHGPFIFDDEETITKNPTIRHVWSALFPPVKSTVGGRPVINLTLALNYALNGTGVWGYHAFNLLVHTLAGLVLFGIVRQALQQPVLKRRFGEDATLLALAVAVIWVVHPLQTEAVTYVSQRAESLMGLFYLLTLYSFVRGTEAEKSRVQSQESRGTPALGSQLSTLSSGLWFSASVISCLLGMASKEVMVSAPLIVLLYDRTFVAGTFREAWRKRRLFYAALAVTWLLLAGLVAGTHGRGGSAGFGTQVTGWSYALTQFPAIVHYLRLSLWPDPLVLDYGTRLATQAEEVVPYAVIVLLLVIATVFAVWRRPVLGFVGCWFFAILAPSSSVVPIVTQTMAEHRMYLALAAVVVLAVLGLYSLLGRRGLVVCAAAAVGLGCLTVQRNKAYFSDLAIWSDTVAKCPGNVRARYNLGNILVKLPNRLPDAIAQYETALQIDPNSAETHNNYGHALLKMPGHLSDAIAQFETALQLDPDSAKAHNNLGLALFDLPGRLPDAMAEFEAALRLDPDLAEAHNNLGTAFLDLPERGPDAMAEFEAALRLDPDLTEAHDNLGTIFLKMPGRLPDAITQFEAALRLNPDSMEAHSNLGSALLNEPGRLPDAIAQYEAAVRLDPASAGAHYNLGNALLNMPGRVPDAISQLQAALRLAPDYARAREMLNQLQNPHGLEGAAPMDSSLHSNDTH
jgi:tetratricopeptide (TPR) repeat protein